MSPNPTTAAAEPTPLSLATLGALPPAVRRPGYERADLTPGIVHFGVGNFHRAHQAVYLDRLMGAGLAHDWAIIGVGTRPGDVRTLRTLEPQDWLTTVVEQSAEASSARVTGPMVGMIAPDDTERTLRALADPRIRIVSLTITEGGYYVSAETGGFDAAHPEIVADLDAPEPRTVFGLILAGLGRRRAAGVPPFTVMSCDNLPHNGAVCRAATVGLARLRDPALADWVEAEVAFPNGMVDRITPATGERERRLVRGEHGVADDWPVFCEDFIQWVLEDRFPTGRPPFEEAGVEFVGDVAAHEAMKLRILNGGHAVIAYPAALLGVEFAHEAMAHPLVSAFLDRIETGEIIPRVGRVPGTDPAAYYTIVRRRFANPKIADTIARLCLDGSNRQPKFIVPTIADAVADGGALGGLALESALWCRYCAGTTEAGEPIAPNDPAWDALTARAAEAKERPAAWLEMREVYGAVGEDARFAAAFAGALEALWRDGTAATLETYLASGPAAGRSTFGDG